MMSNPTSIAIIITAAGSSTRIGGNVKKEYLSYKNGTVLSNCAIAFLKADYKKILGPEAKISNLIVTCPVGGENQSKDAFFKDPCITGLLKNINYNFVEGGVSRQQSVFNALDFIHNQENKSEIVLIHDGARPFITESVILDVVKAVVEEGAAVPGITPIDTQKEIDENGFIVRHLVRKNLVAVQTPQGFSFKKLFNAHKQASVYTSKTGYDFTDDTEIWGQFVGAVKTVKGNVNNIKITYPSDLERL